MAKKKLKERKWFQALMGIAPTVATALGGPFAGLAANAIKKATGLEGEVDLEAAITAGDPEVLLALKTAEQQFELELEKLGLEKERLEYDDRADARARQMATKDITPAVLTAVALAFFFGLTAAVLYNVGIVDQHESFIMYLFGVASGWATQGMSFYLGSSKGSKDKTNLMNGHAP
jgi:hypothetical protein